MKNLQPTFRGGVPLFTVLLLLIVWAYPASAGDYVIGPRDSLKITVWGQQDLSQKYNVSVEGTIVFPLIGEVRAAGLTEAQLGQKLVNLLEKDYLVNPQVMVSVEEYKSKKVLVLGEAEKPGAYPLTGNTTVLEIVSQAGGFGKSAGKQLVLLRPVQRVAGAGSTVPAGNTIRRLNIEKIQAGDTSENVEVEDGDTLFIPKANAFFVLGEVSRPGSFTLEKETTVLEAVTFAGGFTNKASPSGAKIIRKRPEGGPGNHRGGPLGGRAGEQGLRDPGWGHGPGAPGEYLLCLRRGEEARRLPAGEEHHDPGGDQRGRGIHGQGGPGSNEDHPEYPHGAADDRSRHERHHQAWPP